MDSLVTSLTSGFSTMADDAISAIGSIVPYALPVMGAIVVITIAIKIFRRIAR